MHQTEQDLVERDCDRGRDDQSVAVSPKIDHSSKASAKRKGHPGRGGSFSSVSGGDDQFDGHMP